MASEKYEDLDFMSDVRAAVLRGPRLSASLLLLGVVAFFFGAGVWASMAELDVVTMGTGRVIPSSELQVIQNLEGGIVASIQVDEGDIVEKGQLLATIDDTQANSKYREDQSKVLALQARIARLDAQVKELDEPVFPEDVLKNGPDLAESEKALFNARVSEYKASLSGLKDQREQRRQEIAEQQSKIEQLRGSEALARQELDILRPLVEKGVSARIELLRLERQINDISGELATTEKSIPRARSALREIEQRIKERTAAFEAQSAQDLVAAQGELGGIREVVTGAADRVRRTDIRSPVSGIVQQVLIKTIGGVIRPGQDFMHIVPIEDNLLVEAQIRPKDIAFLHPGQDATVKITAYDFSIYGGLSATLEQISADTITNEDGESFYKIRVRTKRTFLLDKDGSTLPIIPGMVAQVDILTGKKTVMDYLLKPVLKARYTALRER